MIAIIDFGSGNLRSVQKAFEKVGAKAVVTQDPKKVTSAQKVVFPGVGAIKPAMEKLRQLNLVDAIKTVIADGKPFLGICLGLQLLFDESDEGGAIKGLGIIAGRVKKFTSLKVPHMGWNQIRMIQKENPLYRDIEDLSYVYFCHSFFVQPKNTDIAAAQTDYGVSFTSSIKRKNLYGVQFHPEKSQTIGLKIIENFARAV